MANIIWSFGIALNAQDEASGPINDVIGSLNTMEKTLSRVNEKLIEHANLIKSMKESYGELNDDLGRFNGFERVGQQASDSFGGGLDALEGFVTGGISFIVKGIASVLGTVVGAVIKTITTIASMAFTIVSKTVSATLSLAWSLVKGTASVFKTILLAPFNLVKTVLDSGFLLKISDSVERFLSLGNSFGPIDRNLRQLGAQMGMTTDGTKGLIDSVVNMSIKSGFAVRNVSDLAVALGKTGQSLASIDPDTAKVMGHIAETFGLGAEETVRFKSGADRVGTSLRQLATDAVVFGQKFGLPGLMRVMPEITNMAADAIGRFSKNVVGSQKTLAESTLRTTAIYAKAFGKDVFEATRMAQASFETFAGAAQHQSDLMLGLQNNISPLSEALLIAGADWQSMNDIIDQGKTDQPGAVGRMRQLLDTMAEGPAKMMAFRKMQMSLDEGARLLLSDDIAYRKALEQRRIAQAAQTGTIREGVKSFDEMTEAMRDNFLTLNTVIDNIKLGIKSLFGALFTDTFKSSLKEVVGRFEAIGTQISGLVAKIKATPEFEKFQQIVGKLGGYLFTAGKGAGALAEGLFSVSTVTSILTPVTALLTTIGAILDRSFKGGKFSLVTALKEMFNEAKTYLGSVLAQWNRDFPADLDTTFSNAGRTVGRKVGEIAKTVADFVKGLFNPKQREEVMGRLKSMFVATESEKNSISGSLLSITRKTFSAIKEFLHGFSEGVLAQFGTNTETFLEGLSLKFQGFVLTIKETFYGVKDALLSIVQAVIPAIKMIGTGITKMIQTALDAAEYAEEVLHPTWLKYQNDIQDLGKERVQLTRDIKKAAEDEHKFYKAEQFDEANAALERQREAQTRLGEVEEELARKRKSLREDEAYSTLRTIEAKRKSVLGVESKLNAIDEKKYDANKEAVKVELGKLEIQRSQLDAKSADLALIEEILSGQKSVGLAISEAIGKQRLELVPRLIKAAFDQQKIAAEQAQSKQEVLIDTMEKAIDRKKEEFAPEPRPKGVEGQTSRDDIKSNYEKMVKLTDKNTANAWLLQWARDDFALPVPAMPEEGSEGTNPIPEKPAVASPTTVTNRMQPVPAEQGREDLKRLEETVAALVKKQSEPINVRFSYDGPTTEHLVKITLNGESSRQLGMG